MDPIVEIVQLCVVFGFPASLLALFLRQRHKEKMRALDNQAGALQVAALEEARADLEMRVRTLETIVTEGDHDLEHRLRRLSAAARSVAARSAAGAPAELPPASKTA
jgi:hypothetical protein